MIKRSKTLSEKEILDAVDRMPAKSKLRIFRKLQNETHKERWKEILDRIAERVKKYPITQEEIDEEIAAARREHHAKSRT